MGAPPDGPFRVPTSPSGIQPLANFGKANAAWSTCRNRGDHTCTTLRRLLDDYRDATRDPRGTTLFRAGHSHARWLVPFSDTGTWSLYSLGGPPSTVEYHTLLRDILANLCKRIGTDVYCTTADRFTQYLNPDPPG